VVAQKREEVALGMMHTVRMCARAKDEYKRGFRGGSRILCAKRKSTVLSMTMRGYIHLLRGTGMDAASRQPWFALQSGQWSFLPPRWVVVGCIRGGAETRQTGVWVCTWTLTVSKGYSMSLQTKPATMPAPAASSVSAGGGQCSFAVEEDAEQCAAHEQKTYRRLSHFATFGQRSAPHPPTSSLLLPLPASTCPSVSPFSRSTPPPRLFTSRSPGECSRRRCERSISRQDDGEDGAEMRSPFQHDSDVGDYGSIASLSPLLVAAEIQSIDPAARIPQSSNLRDFADRQTDLQTDSFAVNIVGSQSESKGFNSDSRFLGTLRT
jgi:hypothetical protein